MRPPASRDREDGGPTTRMPAAINAAPLRETVYVRLGRGEFQIRCRCAARDHAIQERSCGAVDSLRSWPQVGGLTLGPQWTATSQGVTSILLQITAAAR
jgi:hypothetical protein